MSDDASLYFQYCPKLILFSADWNQVLLARRHGETDYDGTFSLIGGKMETTDASLLVGVQREKNEEIGTDAQIGVCLTTAYPVLFRKKSGDSMILPHHIAQFVGGEISLNTNEYSEYRWVPVAELTGLQPIIASIPEAVEWALEIRQTLHDRDFVTI